MTVQEEEKERPPVSYGDRETALRHEILRTEVGSGLHGIAIEGQDDHDEMGVFIEPPDVILGLTQGRDKYRDHYISRTQPEGVRSGPGDTDLTIYGLRKYIRLAVVGNPTVLLPMWAPEDKVILQTRIGRDLRALRKSFLSRYSVERFLAYMHAQHDRMLGYGRRSAVPNRPELIEQYGYDTKYAAHALRLAFQGYEIAAIGQLTLPLADDQREMVLSVKRGEHELEWVSAQITTISKQINRRLEEGKLAVPDEPRIKVINEFSKVAHLRHWKRWGLT
jgi:hypothetical protein